MPKNPYTLNLSCGAPGSASGMHRVTIGFRKEKGKEAWRVRRIPQTLNPKTLGLLYGL